MCSKETSLGKFKVLTSLDNEWEFTRKCFGGQLSTVIFGFLIKMFMETKNINKFNTNIKINCHLAIIVARIFPQHSIY